MKYLFLLLFVIFSFGAVAQVQKAKDDLPENKINPNPKAKQPVAFDRRMYEKKSNKHHKEKLKRKRRRKEKEEVEDDHSSK